MTTPFAECRPPTQPWVAQEGWVTTTDEACEAVPWAENGSGSVSATQMTRVVVSFEQSMKMTTESMPSQRLESVVEQMAWQYQRPRGVTFFPAFPSSRCRLEDR